MDCGLLVLDSSYLKVDNGLGLRIVDGALAICCMPSTSNPTYFLPLIMLSPQAAQLRF